MPVKNFEARSTPPADGVVVFSSSNNAVATVSDSGVVQAVAEGHAVVTATVTGGATAVCSVVVNPVPSQHVCQHVCPTCGLCTDAECTDPACADKCPGHGTTPTEHVCQHVCPTCGKCLDGGCEEDVCADKCTGHVAPHECIHPCPICGLCLDADCDNPACVDKCPGHEPVVEISLNQAEIVLFRGDSVTLVATATEGATVTFSSNASSVASVHLRNGVISTSTETGTAVITATASKDGEKATATCVVAVVEAELTIVQSSVRIDKDNTEALQFSTNPSDASVVFESSNPAVATVDGLGNIVAVESGSCVVTAYLADYTYAYKEIAVVVPQEVQYTISVNPTILELEVGDTAQLTATTNPAGAAVKFVSSDSSVVSVDEQGNVVALAAGDALVRAIVDVTNGQVAICTVLVSEKEEETDPGQEAVELSLTTTYLSLCKGDTAYISATATEGATITFQSVDESVATVSSAGLVTAVAGGTAFVSVKATKNGVNSKTLYCTVDVQNVSLAVTPASLSLSLTDEPRALSVAYSPNDKTLSFVSSNPAVATVSEVGVVTPLTEGSTTITIKVVGYDFTETTCVVTVTDISVSLDKESLTMYKGGTATLKATSAGTVTFESSDTSVATVNESGVVTAVAIGTCVITAKVQGSSAQTTCNVTVSNVTISLDKTALSFDTAFDNDKTLNATVNPSSVVVLYESSNVNVATVSSSGVVTPVGAGSCVITATASGYSYASDACQVTVGAVTVTLPHQSIETTLYDGTINLAATLNTDKTTVTYSSSNDSIATVDSNGVVTVHTVGTATITATVVGVNNVKANCEVTVKTVSITLDKTSIVLDLLSTAETITPTLGSANTTANFVSSDTSIVTVSASGVVTPVGAGTATITVSVQGQTAPVATCAVRVDDVTLSLNKYTMNLGLDDSPEAIVATCSSAGATILWSSSNESVVTVSSTGVVTVQGAGTATVTATVQGLAEVYSQCVVTVGGVTVSLDRSTVSQCWLDDPVKLVATASSNKVTVLFSSSNTSVATVDADGTVHAVAPGTAVITAYVDGHEGTATCNVTFTDATISLNTTAISMFWLESSASISATASHTKAVLEYTSNNTSVVTVSASGVVTPVAVGNTTITISIRGQSANKVNCSVQIKAVGISLNTNTITVYTVDDAVQLTATKEYSGATVTWSTGNSNIATVSNSGLVTPKAAGTTTITAKISGQDTPVATCTVTVNAVTYTVNVDSIEMYRPDAAQKITVTPCTNKASVTFHSNNESVATVDSSGNVSGVAAGTTTVTITVSGSTVVKTVDVTIKPVQLTVVPTSVSMTVGEVKTVTATVVPSYLTINFISNDTNVVTTTGSEGEFTAQGVGTTTVRVVTVDAEATVSVTVTEAATTPSVNTLSFMKGIDMSSVISLEQSGVTYKDDNNTTKDVFQILAAHGVTTVRVRIWNDPYDSDGNGYGGGNNDIAKAVEIGQRVTAAGMDMLIDFHYSDFWADPSYQLVPKAWSGYSVSQKATAIYNFTKDCLDQLNEAHVAVRMVQIGNETNAKLCGETSWSNIATLMNAGSRAVREVYPGALVATHFTNPEKGYLATYASNLKNYSVDYDVFGTSYYPCWHGTLSNLSTVLNNIGNTYNKYVMVLETQYPYINGDTDGVGNTINDNTTSYNTEKGYYSYNSYSLPYAYSTTGQYNMVKDIFDTVAALSKGLGVCYWEGAWISIDGTATWTEAKHQKWTTYGSGWATAYAAGYHADVTVGSGTYVNGGAGSVVDNQAFFDANGKALSSLDVFLLTYSDRSAIS